MNSLEVCANSFSSALAAQNGGAIRAELCENMAEGGTTPSFGQIKLCKERLNLQIWPIIRPRGGDFLYDNNEFDLMKEDVRICKELNCDGVVLGILTSDGKIDKERCKFLINLAFPMPIAFHRAFDMTANLSNALEDLIEVGFIRVLTSGGAESAFNGINTIEKLIKQADGRIEIMPGAGINYLNIQEIKDQTGATTFHSSARIKIASKMQYKNETTKMGNLEEEYQYDQTSADLVKKMVDLLNTN